MKEENKLRQELATRREYLDELIQAKVSEIDKAPEGMLRVSSHRNKCQYYHRRTSKEKNGVYIRKDQQPLASALAQKNYNQLLVEAAQEEKQLIQNLENFYQNQSLEQVIQSVPQTHQPLITPIQEPFDSFIANWMATPYQPKEFSEYTPEFYSEKGERMRSKSEVLIANLLTRYSVPYLYEKPLYLRGIGTVYPDFTLIDRNTRQEMYWEHMGMLNDSDYREHALSKITHYERNDIFPGERLILTHETSKNPLNMRVVEELIKKYWA